VTNFLSYSQRKLGEFSNPGFTNWRVWCSVSSHSSFSSECEIFGDFFLYKFVVECPVSATCVGRPSLKDNCCACDGESVVRPHAGVVEDFE
jgi:hypothetical protein